MIKVCATAFISLALLSSSVFAQSSADFDDEPQIATEVPVDGFFPTPLMIDRFINRGTEHMADQFEFDDEQLDFVRTVLKSRIPQWLQLHKAEIKVLTNEYLEAILHDEPPSPQDVSRWSDRVLPLVDGFQEVIERSAEDFEPVMTDDQLVTLEGDLAALRVGMSFVRSKLELWREGGYDPDVDWPHGSRHDEIERLEQEALENAQREARAQATGTASPKENKYPGNDNANTPSSTPTTTPATAAKKPASKPATSTDEWDQYVTDFVAHYELNPDQVASARRYLQEAKRMRDRYQTIKVDAFRKIEKRLSTADADDIADIQAEYNKLRAPIDRYFQKLKDRLNKLPTRAQRKAAAERPINPKQQPTTTPAKG